jgi:hypothetical protein
MNMADWFIATEGVKVVKDGASLAPQIITAVTSIGAALGGVALTHYFTRKREERAAEAKQASERLFMPQSLSFCSNNLPKPAPGSQPIMATQIRTGLPYRKPLFESQLLRSHRRLAGLPAS